MKKEEISKFYTEYKLYIFPIAVALSSLFLIVFAIYPQTIKLLENQNAASSFISKSQFLETKAAALESFDGTDLSKKVGFVLTTFPTDKDYGNILGLMQQLTAQSGFSILSISLSNSSNKNNQVNSYTIRLQVKGSKALLQTLLSNLESSSRLLKISSIDVSSNQASQVLDAALVVEALYSGLPQNFGSSDSPLPQISQQDEDLLATLARINEAGSSSIVAQTSVSPRGKSNPFE